MSAVLSLGGVREQRRELLWVALLSLLWLAVTAWARPLMLPDEGRYVGVAWEALRSGEWLTPLLNGQPFFHKPPLFYWITELSLSLFGLHQGAARAAPLLGAWLGGISLFAFARRWGDARHARLALLALLAQPLFFVGAQFANLDMLVAGCIGATVLAGADAALRFEQGLPHRRALLLAYGLAALGVLAKGLIGFVLPGLVLAAWLLLRRRWRSLRALLWLPGPLLMLALAVPWFWLMQQRHPGFLHYFFTVQHLQRFAGGGFNNAQPFWFYPVLLLGLSLPWLPWLWRLCRRDLLADPARRDLRLLMLLWLGLLTLFFSLPQSKLVGYIFPVLPALAWLMADGWLLAEADGARRRGWDLSLMVSALAGVAVVLALALHPMRGSRELARSLVAQRSGAEPVFMLERYDYDLPFYARLTEPMWVVDDWASPDLRKRDNWRKELAEARDFAAPGAPSRLLDAAALPAALCAAPVSWVLAADPAPAAHAWLGAAERVASRRGVGLWRVVPANPALASRLGCAGRPNGG